MSLSLADRQAILALLHQEVVPALGCTEPIAVALTAARAAEALGRKPERLDVAVSANLLKNGMGVMVPGTGEMGLAIAAAAGALGGKSALGLECLASLDPAQAEAARAMVAADAVELHLPDNDLRPMPTGTAPPPSCVTAMTTSPVSGRTAPWWKTICLRKPTKLRPPTGP